MAVAEPLENIVQIKTEKTKVGAFDTSSKDSAVEFAEVVAVGPNVNLNVGDKIFVKAWGIDLIFYEGEWYKFVNMKTNAIVAKVHGV